MSWGDFVAGYVILGVLSAFGVLCGLWTAFGWLLPAEEGCVIVFCGYPKPERFARIRWLKSLGLLSCPVVIVAEDGEPEADTEIIRGEDLLSRLERENEQVDGTGNGDHSGHHQCGGVP